MLVSDPPARAVKLQLSPFGRATADLPNNVGEWNPPSRIELIKTINNSRVFLECQRWKVVDWFDGIAACRKFA